MTRNPGPMDDSFANGYRPADEPPGLSEFEYVRWKGAGGVVVSNCEADRPEDNPPPDGAAVYYDANDLRNWWHLSVPVREGVRPVNPQVRAAILRNRENRETRAREAEVAEAERMVAEGWYEAGAAPAGNGVSATDARRLGLLDPPELVAHTAPLDPRGRVVVGEVMVEGSGDSGAVILGPGGKLDAVPLGGSPDFVRLAAEGNRLSREGDALLRERAAIEGEMTTDAGGRRLDRESWQRFDLLEVIQAADGSGPARVVKVGAVRLPPLRFSPDVVRVGRFTYVLDRTGAVPRYVGGVEYVAELGDVFGVGGPPDRTGRLAVPGEPPK